MALTSVKLRLRLSLLPRSLLQLPRNIPTMVSELAAHRKNTQLTLAGSYNYKKYGSYGAYKRAKEFIGSLF